MRGVYLLTLMTIFMSITAWQVVKYRELDKTQAPLLSVKVEKNLSVDYPNSEIVSLVAENSSTPLVALPAFPEAQGGGAGSQGGRGGKVYLVTNLEESGLGSLRYGLEKLTGARTIIFRVAGYIHLSYPIVIERDGFITIAGQTAPGDGITLTTVNSKEPVLIFRNAHDIILRYLRIRKGGTKAKGQHGSGLVISQGGKDIIVDHCSVSWTGDDNINIWANSYGEGGLKKITIQNSISSEGLNYGHPGTSVIVGGSAYVEKMKDISIHHNLFANNKNRNPLLKVASGDIINNIIYNWSWWATGIGGGMEVDIIANKYKAGPMTIRRGRGEIVYKSYDPKAKTPAATGVKGSASIYFEGNIGPHNLDPSKDGWNLMMEHANSTWSYPHINGKPKKRLLSQKYRRENRRNQDFPIVIERAEHLESILLKKGGVGASRRLSADGSWVNNRDLIDQRLIQEYYKNGGKLVQTVDDVGGWPVYIKGHYRYVPEKQFIKNLEAYHLNAGVAYRDSDGDGMPDIWEEHYHLDKHNNKDAIEDRDGDGYDNLEEFLNATEP